MIEFLGRKKELSSITDALKDIAPRKILVISGVGGIGKTRLLQQIPRAAGNLPNVRILDIIDFDIPGYHIPQIIGRHIARQFSQGFEPYLESLYLRQRAEDQEIDFSKLTIATRDTNGQFIACLNKLTQETPIILRFDTVEKIVSQETATFLVQTALKLQNIVLVFAGRTSAEGTEIGIERLLEQLQQSGADSADIVQLPLGPFEADTIQIYVDRKQDLVGLTLDGDWRAKLSVLTAGRPVLIDLAVEIGNHVPAAEWLRNQSAKQLLALKKSEQASDQQELERIRSEFERQLVAEIANVRTPIDQLAILLATVSPIDQPTIAAALNIELTKAQALFDLAAQRVSFKAIDATTIMLHDAVRDLIRQHVLDAVDPNQERRHTYARRAIIALEEKVQQYLTRFKQQRDRQSDVNAPPIDDRRLIDERNYQQARLQIIDLTFELAPLEGLRRLKQELTTAQQQGNHPADISPMFHVAQQHLSALRQASMRDYVEFEIMLASHYYDTSQYEAAQAHFRKVEHEVSDKTPLRFEILDGYGAIEMGIGNLEGALRHFQEGVELAETLDSDSYKVRARLSCGWATRALGLLPKAVTYYQEALQLTLKADYNDNDAIIRRATALNGLSYVYAIQSNRRKANEALNQAITIRKNLGENGRYFLAQSYATAGEVYCELEEPETALKYLDLAENMFIELETAAGAEQATGGSYRNWLAKVYSARGRAYEALADLGTPDDRKAYLPLAEELLKKAVTKAMNAEKPRALQRLGFLYSCTPERRKEAAETWITGAQAAHDYGDIFMELNCTSLLAYLAVYGIDTGFPDYRAFQQWRDEYKVRNPAASFQVVQARFSVYLGCLALQDDHVAQAFDYFNEGLGYLADEQRQSTFSFRWQLRFLEHDVAPTCSPESWQQVWDQLLKRWMEANKGEGVEGWTTLARWRK